MLGSGPCQPQPTNRMFFRRLTRFLAPVLACVLLASCASRTTKSVSNATTSSKGGYYKVGQPYQIKNEWYYPQEDYSYDETGIASWYGQEFHDRLTANGETFNKEELTAAHKTLPLPSLARVTNLENGRSIVVRVNDRGPFAGSRIIDMSQRSAHLLGFERQGTAKVRVQVLADESKAIADAMRRYGRPMDTQASTEQASVIVSDLPPNLYQNQPQARPLAPLLTNEETHRQMIATKPVPQVLQLPVKENPQIYIQAGAFTVPENAERMQRKLTRFGPSSISRHIVNGALFYRVRVGPVGDIPEADDLLIRIKRAGIEDARTIVD